MDKTWPELNDVASVYLNNWHFRNSSHYAASEQIEIQKKQSEPGSFS